MSVRERRLESPPPHAPQDITRTQPQRSGLHLLTALLSGIEPLTRTHFLQAVVPALRVFPAEMVAGEVGLSISYCAKIRAGRCTPGRKHWETFRRSCRAMRRRSGSGSCDALPGVQVKRLREREGPLGPVEDTLGSSILPPKPDAARDMRGQEQ